MRLDRLTPSEFRLTLSDEELHALIAAARCSIEPGCTELTETSHARVERLVKDYDEQVTAAATRYPATRPSVLRLEPPADDYVGAQYDPF
jgi:hypothetical protein